MKKLLDKAIVIAVNAHAGQFDKAGEPYCLHALKVMHYVASYHDEEISAIAVLHDTVEDCDITFADLKQAGMSDRVVEGVRALTKFKGQTYEEYKQEVFANRDAMIVKLADLRHNSDIRRIKEVSQRDVDRTARYRMFAKEISERLRTL